MAEAFKFEEGLKQLEELVEELEGGELDLDEALKRFEKGVKLSHGLNAQLDEANRKVEKLLISDDGSSSLETLDGAEHIQRVKKVKGKKSRGPQDTLF